MLLRLVTLSMIVLGWVVTPVAARQNATASVEVAAFYGGTAKTGYWLPVHVTVANDGPDRNAVVRLGNANSGMFDVPVELPRGARKSLVMYVRPVFTRTNQALLLDGDQELARDELTITPVSTTAQVIGLVMEQPLTAPLPVPPPRIKQATPTVMREDIPARAEGLAMFDALVMDGAAFEGLTTEQIAALNDWVEGGGQLVIGVGQDPAVVATLPPAFQIAMAQPLAQQAVEGTVLGELGAGAQVRAAALTPTEDSTALDALAVQRMWGRGRISMVGFSLSDLALQQLPRDTTLWGSLMQIRHLDPNMHGEMSIDDVQEQQFAQALYNLPALKLPPLNVLAALLVAYIVVVGPGLFFLLRRLDRQALAWVLIPAITVVFALSTYGYGLSIRGNDVILNEVSFVQPLGDQARIRTFAGIFSPTARSYDIEMDDVALTRPLQFDPGMWGREPAQGAAQGGGRGQFIQGSGEVRDLVVGQWSMTTFTAEARKPYQTLEAHLELGERTLRGTIRNLSDSAIRDIAVIYGSRPLVVGNLEAGASTEVEFPIANMGPNNGQSLAMTIFRNRWNMQMGPPPELRIPVQIIDSLYSYTPATRPTSPVVIGWLDGSPLDLRADAERVQHQQLTLVEAPVELSYASAVAFPRGLLTPEYDNGANNNQCMSQWGSGTIIESDAITTTLRLPLGARDLAVTKATLFPQVEGQPPDRILSEVFDWQADAWKGQTDKVAAFDLSDPQRFFRDGEMRVRFQMPAGGARGGCMVLDSSIEGTR
jgi:hypothetical protein